MMTIPTDSEMLVHLKRTKGRVDLGDVDRDEEEHVTAALARLVQVRAVHLLDCDIPAHAYQFRRGPCPMLAEPLVCLAMGLFPGCYAVEGPGPDAGEAAKPETNL